MRNLTGLVVGVILLGVAQGQGLQFEVATVKPMAEPPRIPVPLPLEVRFAGPTAGAEQVRYTDVTLRMMLAFAYGLALEQVQGAGWMDSDRFEVQGKIPAGTTRDQVRQMMQGLLTERFRVQFHREQKNTAVYELVVAKGGPKLRPPQEVVQYADAEERKAALQAMGQKLGEQMKARAAQGSLRGFTTFTLTRATMAEFINQLAGNVDRPVVDKTGIEGLHAYSLEWVKVELRATGEVAEGPSIFAALEEQLGLSLKAVNESYGRMVVDSAERLPEAN